MFDPTLAKEILHWGDPSDPSCLPVCGVPVPKDRPSPHTTIITTSERFLLAYEKRFGTCRDCLEQTRRLLGPNPCSPPT